MPVPLHTRTQLYPYPLSELLSCRRMAWLPITSSACPLFHAVTSAACLRDSSVDQVMSSILCSVSRSEARTSPNTPHAFLTRCPGVGRLLVTSHVDSVVLLNGLVVRPPHTLCIDALYIVV